MKLIFDTNVLVSGILWQGLPNKILLNWFEDKFLVCVSESILDEYETVLKRLDFGLSDKEIQNWIRTIVDHSSIILPAPGQNIIREDPSDDKFLECAGTANANYIISGDKHLLKLKEYERIKIVSPTDFQKENPEYFTDY